MSQNSADSIPHLPLREATHNLKDIEHYLGADGENLDAVQFGEWPEQLEAGGSEAYTNWLEAQTRRDPRHFERGGVISLNTQTGHILYPINPQVGDLSVPVMAALDRTSYSPLWFSHSHPNNLCFSVYDPLTGHAGDLGIFMCGAEREENQGGIYVPQGMSVGTPDANFWLLRQSDTPVLQKATMQNEIMQWRLSTRYAQLVKLTAEAGKEINARHPTGNSYFIKRAVEDAVMALSHLGPSIQDYANDLQIILAMAERYDLGFYISAKDGRYTRVTQQIVDELINHQLHAAIALACQRYWPTDSTAIM